VAGHITGDAREIRSDTAGRPVTRLKAPATDSNSEAKTGAKTNRRSGERRSQRKRVNRSLLLDFIRVGKCFGLLDYHPCHLILRISREGHPH